MIQIIILVVATILAGVTMSFFVFAVLEVVRVVIVLLAMPVFAMLFSDFMGEQYLELERNYALAVGFAFSIPLAIVLYANFYALLAGTILLFALYFIARAKLPKPPSVRK
nr:hypothetical protein 22 [bacterium]